MRYIFEISIVSIFLLVSFHGNGQCRCSDEPFIVEVKSINGAISAKESNGIMSKLNGFPILDCMYRDGCCEFPNDRFLVSTESGNYLIIDSTYNEIIAESDSIIAFSYWSLDSVVNHTCSPDYRGRMKIFYQAIREELTYLYDYDGKLVTTNPYKGEIYEGSYNLDFNDSYWVSVNCHCDSMKMGLIDSTGRSIMEQSSISKQFISQFDQYYPNLWISRNTLTNETELIDVSTGDVLLKFDGQDSYRSEYGIFIYRLNGKYGVFHPSEGIVIQPKYNLIKQVDNKSDTYILLKKTKEIKWIVDQEIKNNYTHQKLKCVP